MDLKQALDIRAPKITDKEGWYATIQRHVGEGNLTSEEGQAYIDKVFIVEYDEGGIALNEQRVLEVVEYTSPEEKVIELEGVVSDLLQVLADKGVVW